MQWIVNELSIDGGFDSIDAFFLALIPFIKLRHENPVLKKSFLCGAKLSSQPIINDIKFMKAVLEHLDPQMRALTLNWVAKGGVFWDATREDNDDDYFEFEALDVTDYGVGECSRRILAGKVASLVSLISANVMFRGETLVVTHGLPESPIEHVFVNNITSPSALEKSALSVVPRPNTWPAAIAAFRNDFKSLHISDSVEEQLSSQPFGVCPYTRMEDLLKVLQDFMCSRDPDGKYTAKTRDIINEFFSGEKAWFSDESVTNKRDFRKELTFVDPVDKSKNIFCSFHGKIKSPQLRIHFCFPNATDKILKICYIGPKITKR